MYFVIYQDTENVYEPGYDRHDIGGYRPMQVSKYAFVDTPEEMFAYSKKDKVKYFKVEAELFPTFTEKVIVSL